MDKILKDEEYYEKEGFAFWERGSYIEAADVFRRGLWEFPNAVWLHVGLGFSYFYAREYANAAKSFEIAIRLDPTHAESRRGLGLCYIKLNRLEDAKRILKGIFEKLSNHPTMMMELAYHFFLAGQYEASLEYSRAVIEKDPNYCDAYICAAGSLHFLKREPLDKMRMFQRALTLDCTRGDLLDFFGNVLYDEVHMAEALKIFEKIPLSQLTNPVSVQRIIDLYKYFNVDQKIIRRYEERLARLEKGKTLDGLIGAIMDYLSADGDEDEESTGDAAKP